MNNVGSTCTVFDCDILVWIETNGVVWTWIIRISHLPIPGNRNFIIIISSWCGRYKQRYNSLQSFSVGRNNDIRVTIKSNSNSSFWIWPSCKTRVWNLTIIICVNHDKYVPVVTLLGRKSRSEDGWSGSEELVIQVGCNHCVLIQSWTDGSDVVLSSLIIVFFIIPIRCILFKF